jgi:thiol:disulfide interchange protein
MRLLLSFVAQGALLVCIACSVVVPASAVWLIQIAFRTSFRWGLAVWWGYPFGAVAFFVKNRKVARGAGIVHLVSVVTMLVALGVAVGAAKLLGPTPPRGGSPAITASPSPGP